jgi:DNA invertase Pin-like site-specific DNA recombinase
MNAVGYFLDDGRRKLVPGLAEQNRQFLDYCSRQGYGVAATFLDVQEPAIRRPGFEQMVDYLKKPDRGFLEVVVSSLAVMGEELPLAARNIVRVEETGVRVVCLKTGGGAFEALLEAWSRKADPPDISERVRMAMRRKAVRGEVLGRPPYGYRVGPRRKLEAVPEEAQVVRYIFRLYLQEGLGIRLIARRLNEENIKTRRGGNWSMVSIRDILRNRAYVGTYTRFGVRVPGTHPALITADDFKNTQERLESRRGSRAPRNVVPFLLSGLVFCGRCGNRMIGVSRRQRWTRRSDGGESEGQYRYYQCESRTNQSLCEYNTQRAAELEEAVRQELWRLQDSDEPGVEGNARVKLDVVQERDKIKARLARLDRSVEAQFVALLRGEADVTDVRGEAAALASEGAKLGDRMYELEQRSNQQATALQRVKDRQRAIGRLCDEGETLSFEEARNLLRDVVQSVTVAGEQLDVRLR